MNHETSSNDDDSSRQVDDGNLPTQTGIGRKLLFRLGALVVAGFLLVLVGLPTIVAATGLYRGFLDRAAEGRELSVTAESASLAWFSPVILRNADVKRDDQSWEFSTEAFSTEKSLLEYALAPTEIGTISLDRPTVVLQPIIKGVSDGDGDEPPKTRTIYPEFRTVIRDGTVQVRGPNNPDPIIAVDAISFVGRTEVRNETSLLVIEPVKLFDRRALTPELCDQGLQLIAPILSKAATVTGQLSIELDDFQIPIGTVTQDERVALTKISGRMMLHEVETGLSNPLLAEIASVLAALSGGRFASVRASEETEVSFRVEHGRVHHEGLTLLIPELASDLTIRTSGWVDLEEKIDVQILVNVAAFSSSRGDVLSNLMRAPLEIRMTGTLKHPQISLPAGRNMLEQLTGRLGELTGLDDAKKGSEEQRLSGAITGLVDGLVGESEGKPDMQKTARGIFDLIGAIRDKSESDGKSQ